MKKENYLDLCNHLLTPFEKQHSRWLFANGIRTVLIKDNDISMQDYTEIANILDQYVEGEE